EPRAPVALSTPTASEPRAPVGLSTPTASEPRAPVGLSRPSASEGVSKADQPRPRASDVGLLPPPIVRSRAAAAAARVGLAGLIGGLAAGASAEVARAAPCSTRHQTVFERYDEASLVAVAGVLAAPRPMTSGPVELEVVEQLKGAPTRRAQARERGACTAGFYNVHVGKVARTALVFVGADGHAVGYWAGVEESPSPALLDALRAWRDAGDAAARRAILVDAIAGADRALAAQAAYYLADEPALLVGLSDADLARVAASAGGDQWGPEIVLTRRRGPHLARLAGAGALPRDLAALARLDLEAVTSAASLATTIERGRGARRIAALERCERLHGRRLERFSIYNRPGLPRARWRVLAAACRSGRPAPPLT
ncbi:MAG: hypothetical protein KJZ91_21910, partial [Myxococcales bacterium]|nr:hypothetical protein [Myxococcales bacterium]